MSALAALRGALIVALCAIAVAAAAATAVPAPSAPTAADPPMPAAIARRQIEAAVNRDWPALKALYASDVVYADPGGEYRGIDATLKNLERSLEPFGGKIDVTINHLYQGKDFAVVEWNAVAVNDRQFTLADGTKAPATGNEVNLNIVTIYDLKDGRIVAERNYYDGLAVYASLGVLGE